MLLLIQILACVFAALAVFSGVFYVLQRKKLIFRNTDIQYDFEALFYQRKFCLPFFLGLAVIFCVAVSFKFLIPLVALAFAVALRMPSILNKRHLKALQSACAQQLDCMADIVAMGLRSGLSFDGALELYCISFDCELSQVMSQAKSAWAGGIVSRQRALDDAACRLKSKDLERFSNMVVQAIEHGTSLGKPLSQFARDVRLARRAYIERQIEKAPVKMLIPTSVFILPAMLILILGPALLQFMETSV